jgi:methionine--tRNA ligase beta chain
MATITIDDFRNIELRVATITAAEPHPNADRLMVLKIDLGTEQRQLVAGIRAHYEPAALVGRQIVVVANLQPATLRGVESQGMLLAASDADGRLAFVTPEKPVAAGSAVK